MKWKNLFFVACLPLLCGFSFQQCGLSEQDFSKISENGFGADEFAQNDNEYAWAMTYFKPDGDDTGNVYVGTANGFTRLVRYELGLLDSDTRPSYPPSIWRYRPDQGKTSWEKVFDYRDIEDGPQWSSVGFRYMTTYHSQSTNTTYIYAATFGDKPALWRSASGDKGSWEKVWDTGEFGSIRWMTVHNNQLYIAISNDLVDTEHEPGPGQIWATDGVSIWPVMQDGFGNADNRTIQSMISWNGWLYAGTGNAVTGFEIWKLEGPDYDGNPIKIVDHGATDRDNQAACTPYVFQDKLYWGSQIFGGFSFKGAIILRINKDDSWDVIVGPGGLSQYDAGFNSPLNAYIWWMEEHDGWLYASTFDTSTIFLLMIEDLPNTIQNWDRMQQAFAYIHQVTHPNETQTKRRQDIFTDFFNVGADLYKTQDGIHWWPVLDDGLGNPYNYGIRTMVSAQGKLFLGTANPTEGLEIWVSNR